MGHKVGILKTITMYHMHTFVASTCMDMVHSDGFRFGDAFEYTYLSLKIDVLSLQEHRLRGVIIDRIVKMVWRLDVFWSLEVTLSNKTNDI